MADAMDGKSDMPEQKPLRLNPEAIGAAVLIEAEAADMLVVVMRKPRLHERLLDDVVLHLVGRVMEAALVAVFLAGPVWLGLHAGDTRQSSPSRQENGCLYVEDPSSRCGSWPGLIRTVSLPSSNAQFERA
jgi:hypothetical protein